MEGIDMKISRADQTYMAQGISKGKYIQRKTTKFEDDEIGT